MSRFGGLKETFDVRMLRCIAYFLVGVLFGVLPAILVFAAAEAEDPHQHVAWWIPVAVIIGSGALFCAVGILSRGRLLAALLRLLGKEVDYP